MLLTVYGEIIVGPKLEVVELARHLRQNRGPTITSPFPVSNRLLHTLILYM